jgi:hypothetical protein
MPYSGLCRCDLVKFTEALEEIYCQHLEILKTNKQAVTRVFWLQLGQLMLPHRRKCINYHGNITRLLQGSSDSLIREQCFEFSEKPNIPFYSVINSPTTQHFFFSSSDFIATTCFGHTTIIRGHTVVYCLKLLA